MGAATSIHQYDNDFELVIRVSKELERVLMEDFGAPRNAALKEKIDYVYNSRCYDMKDETYTAMSELVTLRNKLVHDYRVNKLQNRTYFLDRFMRVKNELDQLSGKAGEEEHPSVGGIVLLGLGALAIGALAAGVKDEDEEKKKAKVRERSRRFQ